MTGVSANFDSRVRFRRLQPPNATTHPQDCMTTGGKAQIVYSTKRAVAEG